jgi:hypothetical protein
VICDRDKCFVPVAPVAGFVPSDEQDCRPSRIKRKQDAEVLTGSVGTKFFHVVVSRTFDVIDERSTKHGPESGEPSDDGSEWFLEALVKRIPPGDELVGNFYLPHYQTNLILARANSLQVSVEVEFAIHSVWRGGVARLAGSGATSV